jgi:hypothetical protein
MQTTKLLLAKAGSRALKMVSDGFDFEQVSEEKAQERLAICKDCKHLQGDQCGVCGCEVEFKVTLKSNPVLTVFKAKKKENKCPKGFW